MLKLDTMTGTGSAMTSTPLRAQSEPTIRPEKKPRFDDVHK